ncbi:MAG: response regulator [Methylobacteriaceae bacterium]|nr:response regulator [Methylobacteriaceae bacterium]
MREPQILVVEDDSEIAGLVARYLRDNGCHVATAGNGREMDCAIAVNAPDLIVLDLNLPEEDGLSICRRLRATSDVAVIMLIAKGEEIDRIIGLEMGADDYLPKPFNPRELLARIRAVMRRKEFSTHQADGIAQGYAFAGWRLDPALRRLTDPQGAIVTLTAAEFDLLQALAERPNRVLSRDQLLDLTQGRATSGPFDRSIDVLVSRLRQKLERNAREPELIKTVRSGGYVLASTVARG